MMTRFALLAAAAAIALFPAARAEAQHREPLVGREVRVTAPNFAEGPVRGTVTRFDHEGVHVAVDSAGTERHFPVRSVQRIDILQGRGRKATALRRMRLFGFLGAGLGAVAAPLVAGDLDLSIGAGVALFGGAGAVLGGTAGIISGNVSPSEQWSWQISPWGYDRTLKPAP
jgi:hypothetical protein